jgi:Phosphotransferase enzyme family
VWREAVRIAATSVVLAPALLAARLADARRGAPGITGALAALGIVERPREIAALTGGRSSAVHRLAFATRTLVLKRALAGGSVLALGARLCGPQPYPVELSPAARTHREAAALERLARAAVRAPRVVAVNVAASLLLLEYVDGERLPATLARPGAARRIAAYRRAIDAAHAAGLVLNDAHPGNALVVGNDVALIDLEFAERAAFVADRAARRAFDLAYAAAYFAPAERRVFLGRDAGDERVIAAARRLVGYAPLFAYESARLRKVTAANDATVAARRAA